MLLHEIPDFRDLIAVTARELGIDPGLVEKDYWIMHALWACSSSDSSSRSRAARRCPKAMD